MSIPEQSYGIEDIHEIELIHAMAKGIVARLEIAGSREGFWISMMAGQPYQF
jgi:hypothetical protein